jgi:hypothetical protein
VNPHRYNSDLISTSYKSPKQPVDQKHYGNEHLVLRVFSEAFMMTAIQPAYMASHVNKQTTKRHWCGDVSQDFTANITVL